MSDLCADWRLPPEAFEFLRHHLAQPATIVELGSGDGTHLLRELGQVCSIEHDEAWLRTGPFTSFIHAPIVDGWYDPAAIRGKLPDKYDCLIVDGPPGSIGRGGLLANLDLFRQDVPLLLDDVHRELERSMAMAIAQARKTALSLHLLPSGRAFATIGWPL